MALLSDHDDHNSRGHGGSITNRCREVVRTAKVVLRGGGRRHAAERAASRERQPIHDVPPAAYLAPDVLIDFFARLGFNDRLSASHVNRHWRWVALSTPLLWSAFKIRDLAQGGKLETLLCRSEPAPLYVTLLLDSEPEKEAAAALLPHFHRLRALRCQDPPAKLDSPILETLEVVRHSFDQVVLSEDYIGASARSLRTLRLRPFRIATTCPVFSRLREFKAVFSPRTDLGLLLALCPALESLTVCCDIYLAVDPRPLFVALPPRLTEVAISGLIKWDDPSHDSLQSWLGHRFHRLEFARLDNISKGLHLFAPSVSLPDTTWSMEVHVEGKGAPIMHNGVFTVRTSTDSMRVVVPAPPDEPEYLRAYRIHGLEEFPHIAKLTVLRLSPLFFELFCSRGVELLGLKTLAIVVNAERGEDAPSPVRGSSTLQAPLLHSFAFACFPGQELTPAVVRWFFFTLPRHFRKWVRYDAAKLEIVSLEGIIPDSALIPVSRRFSPIYSLAREVRIDTGASAEARAFGSAG